MCTMLCPPKPLCSLNVPPPMSKWPTSPISLDGIRAVFAFNSSFNNNDHGTYQDTKHNGMFRYFVMTCDVDDLFSQTVFQSEPAET